MCVFLAGFGTAPTGGGGGGREGLWCFRRSLISGQRTLGRAALCRAGSGGKAPLLHGPPCSPRPRQSAGGRHLGRGAGREQSASLRGKGGGSARRRREVEGGRRGGAARAHCLGGRAAAHARRRGGGVGGAPPRPCEGAWHKMAAGGRALRAEGAGE